MGSADSWNNRDSQRRILSVQRQRSCDCAAGRTTGQRVIKRSPVTAANTIADTRRKSSAEFWISAGR
jgi:hypothetical protein